MACFSFTPPFIAMQVQRENSSEAICSTMLLKHSVRPMVEFVNLPETAAVVLQGARSSMKEPGVLGHEVRDPVLGPQVIGSQGPVKPLHDFMLHLIQGDGQRKVIIFDNSVRDAVSILFIRCRGMPALHCSKGSNHADHRSLGNPDKDSTPNRSLSPSQAVDLGTEL